MWARCLYTVLLPTKVSVIAHLPSKLDHALPQQALRLWVAGAVHLPADLGHRVEHGELGPGARVGLEVL